MSSDLVYTSRGAFRVEVTGPPSDDTLVFVGGLGDGRRSWDPVLPRMAGLYHCINFDNRGITNDPATVHPVSISDLADDAEVLCQTLGAGTVIAIGSSMGGAVCQQWAIRHPGRHRGLVLSGTWARTDRTLYNLFVRWMRLVDRKDTRMLMHDVMRASHTDHYIREHPALLSEDLKAIPNLAGFTASAYACRKHDATSGLTFVSVPALVIAGQHDRFISPKLSKELADQIPDTELALLPTGHMAFQEQPEAWVRTVVRWFERAHQI